MMCFLIYKPDLRSIIYMFLHRFMNNCLKELIGLADKSKLE